MAGWDCRDDETIEWDGTIKAKKLKGDGSGITNIAVSGDNLGNHLATQTVSGANLYMSGNVGIGTTSPTNSKLEVLKSSTYNSESTAGFAIKSADATYKKLLMGVDTSNNAGYLQSLSYDSYITVPLALQPVGGKVGIGTTSPGTKLEINYDPTAVSGLSLVDSRDAANDKILIDNLAGEIRLYTTSTGVYGNPKMVIQADGDVGIGTSSPTYQLHINGSTYAGQTIESASGNDAFIVFREASTDRFKIGYDQSEGNFKIGRTDFSATNFVINYSTGNVGIGTTSPTNSLHVSGASTGIALTRNNVTIPSPITSGGVLWASGGELYWRGPTTLTRIAVA